MFDFWLLLSVLSFAKLALFFTVDKLLVRLCLLCLVVDRVSLVVTALVPVGLSVPDEVL